MSLFDLIAKGDLDSLRSAIDAGADLHSVSADASGWSVLHAAIAAVDDGAAPLLIQMVLDAGAPVDVWDTNHDSTPLLMAVFRGNKDAVEALVRRGATIDVRSGEGDTPISWACQVSDLELLQILLNGTVGATLNAPAGASGWTPLGYAAAADSDEIVRALLGAGARVDVVDLQGRMARDRARGDQVRRRLDAAKVNR